ncbi:Neuroligin-2 [Dactylellina cionopaga]|nr:Neuroligin-2 [Dactylellina cionopaga]
MRGIMKITLGIGALCSVAAVAVATPGPLSLGTSLTILKENDLYAQYSNKTSSAILIEQPKIFNSAKSACSSLSETLWSPELQDFTLGVNNSLSYQAYLRKFSYSQQFWVADDNRDPYNTCRAIDLAGKVRVLDCNRLLPALCTHSAPISNASFWDTSERYRIAVEFGSQVVIGFIDGYGFRFMSVRYASNPGRFRHSTVYESPGDLEALGYEDVCRQLHDGQDIGSEDCFFLNIATPYLPGVEKQDLKPVLFWIHGGSNVEVNGNRGNSDGINVATRGDVVVVKINYRLGHFGWLAIDGTAITGNYGLGDMLTALKWVKNNINAFGGDPERITIGGDSAGASNVRALMASEKAEGLFGAAIMESIPIGYNPVNLFSHWMTIPESSALFGPMVIQGTGCDATDPQTLETCLVNVDPAVLTPILSPVGHLAFPVVDSVILGTADLPVTGKGYAAKVPLLIGVNRDETGIQLSPYYGIPDVATYLDYIGQYVVFQNLSAFINHPAFPLPPGDPAQAAFNFTQRIVTDGAYKCLSWATAYSAVKHGVLPRVYTYEFNRTYGPLEYTNPLCEPPITAEHPFGDPDAEYFKCHSGELPTAHGEILFGGRKIRDEFDIPFEQLVIDYWTAYIWNNDPNPKTGYLKARGYWGTLNQITKAGKWEKVNTRGPKMMRLQWNGGSVDLSEKVQCEALGFPLDYFEKTL